MNSIAVLLIRIYQKLISPLLPGSCRFYPSCSEYALECFANYNFIKAFLKAFYRIIRCNPFFVGYFDPPLPDVKREERSLEQ